MILTFCLWGTLAYAQTVYMAPDEALKTTFINSQEVVQEKKALSPEQKNLVEKKLGAPLAKNTWNFYIAKTGGKVDGYAVIDNEIGKTEPITFMTAINPDGRVKSVEILVYRETHGSEVKSKTFLSQFSKKSESDPLKVGSDIANMTGATLSSGAITRGVKRDLVLWNVFYGK